MFFRIVRGVFLKHKAKVLIILAASTISALTITLLFTLLLGINDSMAKELRRYGANIVVYPKSNASTFKLGSLELAHLTGKEFIEERSLSALEGIFWANNLLAVTPALEGSGEIEGRKVTLMGTRFGGSLSSDKNQQGGKDEGIPEGFQLTHPYLKITGSLLSEEASGAVSVEGQRVPVLLGERLLQKEAVGADIDIRVNDKIVPVRLIGRVSAGDRMDEYVYFRLDDLQRILNIPGKIDRFFVSALTTPENELAERFKDDPKSLKPQEYEVWYCTPYISSIIHQIQEAIPNVSGEAVLRVSRGEERITRVVVGILGFLSGLTILASILCIAASVSSHIISRQKEIALLRTVGALRPMIAFFFLFESILLGIVSSTLGFLFGNLLVYFLGSSVLSGGFETRLEIFPIILVASLGVTLIGTAIPLQASLKSEIAQSLK